MGKRIYKHQRSAIIKTFDDVVMLHRMRLIKLLQLGQDEMTDPTVDVILTDLTAQLQRDIPVRLKSLTTL